MADLEHIVLDGTTLDIVDNTARSEITRVEGEIPTKTSDLTNDSGFITSANIPTKTSDLTNDSGFVSATYNSGTKTITFA